MKFKKIFQTKLHFLIHQTPFCLAIKQENFEIVKLLLEHDELDINIPFI